MPQPYKIDDSDDRGVQAEINTSPSILLVGSTANTQILGELSGDYAMTHISIFNFSNSFSCGFQLPRNLLLYMDDHNLYVWDVNNLSKISRVYAYFSHNAYIWDISNPLPNQKLETGNSLHFMGMAPVKGLFVTSSTNGTIRLQELVLRMDSKEIHCEAHTLDSKSTNIYCKDTLGVIHLEISGDPIKKQLEAKKYVIQVKVFIH